MKDYKLSEIWKICTEQTGCTNCPFKTFDDCYFKINAPYRFVIDKQDKQHISEIKKFLFVEDGTVDYDELVERIAKTNPEIYVVLYRQGAQPPQLVEVEK